MTVEVTIAEVSVSQGVEAAGPVTTGVPVGATPEGVSAGTGTVWEPDSLGPPGITVEPTISEVSVSHGVELAAGPLGTGPEGAGPVTTGVPVGATPEGVSAGAVPVGTAGTVTVWEPDSLGPPGMTVELTISEVSVSQGVVLAPGTLATGVPVGETPVGVSAGAVPVGTAGTVAVWEPDSLGPPGITVEPTICEVSVSQGVVEAAGPEGTGTSVVPAGPLGVSAGAVPVGTAGTVTEPEPLGPPGITVEPTICEVSVSQGVVLAAGPLGTGVPAGTETETEAPGPEGTAGVPAGTETETEALGPEGTAEVPGR